MTGQLQTPYENTSGMGDQAVIPPGVKGWSWGAFLLNIIWGIGNSVFIALLCLIPLVNIVMMFILGFKGREWAWRKRRWLSVEEFNRTQKKWAIAGLVVWAVFVIGGPAAFHFMFAGQQKLALDFIRRTPEFSELLGEPVKTGWFTTGQISIRDYGSCAIVSVPVNGSKASGRIRMASVGAGDGWNVIYARLTLESGSGMEYTDNDFDTKSKDLEPCKK